MCCRSLAPLSSQKLPQSAAIVARAQYNIALNCMHLLTEDVVATVIMLVLDMLYM